MRPRLIINADDFGLDHRTNRAVVQAFDLGLCSSCTLMANMPGFAEACDLVHLRGLTAGAGLHLTLTEGEPVTDRIKACRRFCREDGRFRLSRRERILHLSGCEREALAEEIEGQIRACRRQGVPLTHLDAHQHVHEEWAILSVVMEIAREAGISYVRRCRTFGGGVSRAKTLYRRVVNLRLRRAGLTGTDYFGTPDDYRLFCRAFAPRIPATSWDVMIHPAFDSDGRLIDAWLKRPLDEMVRSLVGYEQACSYAGSHFGQPAGELQYAVLRT